MLLVAAANVPDLDFAFGFFGRDHSVFLRRGITHSIIGAAILSLFVAWMFRKWVPSVGFRAAALLASLAAGIHLLMDLADFRGIEMLAPISRHRFALNWIPIVDPRVWWILGGGLAFGAFARTWGVAVNRAALVLLASYYLVCGASNFWAVARFREVLMRVGVELESVEAFPHHLSSLDWNVIGRASDRYYQAHVNTVRGLRQGVNVFFRNEVPPGLRSEFVGEYERWAAAPLVRAFADSAKGTVALVDLRFLGHVDNLRRFGRPGGMPFVAKLSRESSGAVRHEWLPFEVTVPDPDQRYEIPR